MESEKELSDVTWKEVYNGDGRTIQSVKVVIKNKDVRNIENGTLRQTLGGEDEKQVQEIHSED